MKAVLYAEFLGPENYCMPIIRNLDGEIMFGHTLHNGIIYYRGLKESLNRHCDVIYPDLDNPLSAKEARIV